MPYKSKEDLPDSVKHVLPEHAQDIYKASFNNAWDQYAKTSTRKTKESREEVSHKVAWAAVKKKYHKVGDKWEENE